MPIISPNIKMDIADIKKLSLEKVGGKAARMMSTSTRINKFLTANHTIPASIRELEKWVKSQSLGVTGQEDLIVLIDEACSREVKKEVDKVVNELKTLVLTKEQQAAMPKAVKAYESFLNDYVAKLKRAKDAVNKIDKAFEEKRSKAEAEAKAKAKPKAKEQLVEA